MPNISINNSGRLTPHYNVVVLDRVYEQVAETVTSLEEAGLAKGYENYIKYAKKLDTCFVAVIKRLRTAQLGTYPKNYPILARLGYKRIIIPDHWSLFYKVSGNTITVATFWDNRAGMRRLLTMVKMVEIETHSLQRP